MMHVGSVLTLLQNRRNLEQLTEKNKQNKLFTVLKRHCTVKANDESAAEGMISGCCQWLGGK